MQRPKNTLRESSIFSEEFGRGGGEALVYFRAKISKIRKMEMLSTQRRDELMAALIRQDHLKIVPTFIKQSNCFKCTVRFGFRLPSDVSDFTYPCPYPFLNTFKDLIAHFNDVHGYGGQLYVCEICEKISLEGREMQIHLHRFCKKSIFQCSGCDQKFASFRALKNHSQRMHPNFPIWYPCKHCPQLFVNKVRFYITMC